MMTQAAEQANESGIFMRLAEPGDAAIIARLLEDSFAEYRELYTVAGYRATAIREEQVIDRIRVGPVWIALLNETIVATVSVVPKGNSLYVRGMAVKPSARGHHIGELLLTRIERFAISEGCERMFLSTTPFLGRAIRLYESFGFQRTEEEPHDLHGTPLFTMQKLLPHPGNAPS